MAKTEAIYGLVARVTDASVDRALAAALPTADTDDQARIAALLVRRNHPAGTAALVAHFDTLGADTRQWVLQHVADLYRPLREVARLDPHNHPPAVANALEIIRRTGEMKLAYLVSERLRHGDEALRQLAAECLLDLARRRDVSAGEASYLHAAVEEAVRLYRHHEQDAVAVAMLWLALRPLPVAVAQLDDPRNPIGGVLKAMLAAGEEPAARAALLPLLGVASLSPSIIAGLRQCQARGALGEALAHGHMLQLPRVRRQLRKAAHADALWPTDEQAAQWPPQQTRHLPAWAATLPLELEVQVQRWTALRHAGDAMTRLAALRQLIAVTAGQPSRDFGQAIAGFCDDAEESIAAVALCELVRRRWDGLARLLPQLVNGPHERVRHLAGRHLAPLGFDRLWQRWPQLTRPQRLAAGRALIKLDPRFHESIGRRLASPDPQAVVRGLSIIADLNQGAFFDAALLQLSRHADRRIASTAVRALGSAESPQARAALEAALRDADARVRANAVEALQQIHSTQHVRQLVEMAQRDDNRPRANAIKALLDMRAGDALAALTQMLADARAKHRRSALWLVETMGVVEVARHVAELAVADPEPAIKQRAQRVMHELIDALHPPAAPPEAPPASSAAACWAWPVLAQASAEVDWQAIGEHFRGGSAMSLGWIAAAAGLLMLLLVVLSMRKLRDRAEASSAPMLVFRRVAEHAGVSLSDQWLLIRIARQQQLPTPLALLLSPGTLMHHGAAYAAGLSDRRRRVTLIRLDALRQELFDTPLLAQPLRDVA